MCSGAGQGQRSSQWQGGALPSPEPITPFLSPAFPKAAWMQGDHRSLFLWLTGVPSKSGFFSLRPWCRAPHGVRMGQSDTYPVLSHAVPSSSPGQRWRHLWAAKHKQEPRSQTLPWHPGGCQRLPPASHPAQRDRHAMASRERWENCVDKPVNSRALPGVPAESQQQEQERSKPHFQGLKSIANSAAACLHCRLLLIRHCQSANTLLLDSAAEYFYRRAVLIHGTTAHTTMFQLMAGI